MKDKDGIDFEGYMNDINSIPKWDKMKFIIKKALEVDRIKSGIIAGIAIHKTKRKPTKEDKKLFKRFWG